MHGIELIKQKEYYSSGTNPKSPEVSKKYYMPDNRITRGLYKDGNDIYNADSVGAYNIMRLWLQTLNKERLLTSKGLSDPKRYSFNSKSHYNLTRETKVSMQPQGSSSGLDIHNGKTFKMNHVSLEM